MSLKPVYMPADQADSVIAAGLGSADPNAVQASAIGSGVLVGIVGALLQKMLESGQLQAVLQQVIQKVIEQLLASLKPTTPA